MVDGRWSMVDDTMYIDDSSTHMSERPARMDALVEGAWNRSALDGGVEGASVTVRKGKLGKYM